MISRREKLQLFNKLRGTVHAEADLALLEDANPRHPKLTRFARDPKRYADEILYALLDECDEGDIVDHRIYFEKLNENIDDTPVNDEQGPEGGSSDTSADDKQTPADGSSNTSTGEEQGPEGGSSDTSADDKQTPADGSSNTSTGEEQGPEGGSSDTSADDKQTPADGSSNTSTGEEQGPEGGSSDTSAEGKQIPADGSSNTSTEEETPEGENQQESEQPDTADPGEDSKKK